MILLIVAILLLVALFLLVPVFVRLEIGRRLEENWGEVSVGLLAGIIGMRIDFRSRQIVIGPTLFGARWIRINLSERRQKRRPVKPKKPKKKPREEPVEKEPWRTRLAKIRREIRIWSPPAIAFIRRTIRAFRIRRFACDLEVGTGDPATTGMIVGWVQAIRPFGGKRIQLQMQANFERTMLEGVATIQLAIRLYLIGVAMVTAAFELAKGWLRDRLTQWRSKD